METRTVYLNLNELINPEVNTQEVKKLLSPKIAKAKRLSFQQRELLSYESSLKGQPQVGKYQKKLK